MVEIPVDQLAPYLSLGLVGFMIVGGMLMVASPFFYAKPDLNRISLVSLFFWLANSVTFDWRASLSTGINSILCMVAATLAMFLVGTRPRSDRQGLAATVFLAMVVWNFVRSFSEPSGYIDDINFLIDSMLWYCLPAIVIFGSFWDAGIGYRNGLGFFCHPDLGDSVGK